MNENQATSTSTSKVALVTGGARRVGAAICRQLHLASFNIAIHYRHSEQEARALQSELNAIRDNSAMLVQADFEQPVQWNEIVTAINNHWGRFDALINNASTFYPTPFLESTEQQWHELFSSNLQAPYFLCQAAASFLKVNKGCIVNITDIHSATPLREHSIYCLAKAGLAMLTKVLAKELGPDVRVNAVAPGAVAWPEGENDLSDTVMNKIIQKTALKRAGHADDVAKAVLFLIENAEYVTGQTIAVDGGRYL